MGIRRKFVALLAVVSAIGGLGLAPAARAASTEPPDAAAVGGGAAGIEAVINIDNDFLFGTIGNSYDYGYELTESLPQVLLPEGGSATVLQKSLVGKDTPAVSAHLLKVTTTGNLRGLPYAASTASAADVRIQTTNIRAVRGECRWDRSGATATTKIVDAAGKSYTPAPNTRVDLPGLGYAILNEQGTDIDYNTGAVTIWVKAVHVYLDARMGDLSQLDDPLSDIDNFIHSWDGGSADIAVGFASCDPLNLPALSGLQLKSGGG
jgi:hypothetical protein